VGHGSAWADRFDHDHRPDPLGSESGPDAPGDGLLSKVPLAVRFAAPGHHCQIDAGHNFHVLTSAWILPPLAGETTLSFPSLRSRGQVSRAPIRR
jgi:hypothetical protein